jgi:hypothetical protein
MQCELKTTTARVVEPAPRSPDGSTCRTSGFPSQQPEQLGDSRVRCICQIRGKAWVDLCRVQRQQLTALCNQFVSDDFVARIVQCLVKLLKIHVGVRLAKSPHCKHLWIILVAVQMYKTICVSGQNFRFNRRVHFRFLGVKGVDLGERQHVRKHDVLQATSGSNVARVRVALERCVKLIVGLWPLLCSHVQHCEAFMDATAKHGCTPCPDQRESSGKQEARSPHDARVANGSRSNQGLHAIVDRLFIDEKPTRETGRVSLLQ